MKKFFCFLLVMLSAHALQVDITYGREQNAPFSIITLTHTKEFTCDTFLHEEWYSPFIQCIIDSIPESGFLPLDTKFFEISYQMINQQFHLIIKGKKKQKLYSIPDHIQESGFFIEERDKKSKTWQILGYEKEIPFLTQEKKIGINFPIVINTPKYHHIAEIGIDKKPMQTPLGGDYTEYLKIKDFIDLGNYRPALNAIARVFKKYPKTLFVKDLLFFQIKALYHLERYDNFIDHANSWLEHYASDNGVPEVLYLLGKAYAHLKFLSESHHYYRRIIDEYPKDRFAPLAKMRIADHLAGGTNIGLARIYYSQAYQETKNTDDAVEIAMQWAIFEIQNNNPQNAQELFEKILKTDTNFFVKHQRKMMHLLQFLGENHKYATAANVAQHFINRVDKEEDNHERVLFLLGLFYEKSKQFDLAHSANLKYLKDYNGLIRAKSVLDRDDALLFDLSGNDKEKLERYNYILDKYPNTTQASKAAIFKANLLLEQKNYQEVLEMSPLLSEDITPYNRALAALINQNIANHNCQLIAQYLTKISDFKDIENKLEVFDCLYLLHFNDKAQTLAQQQMQNKDQSQYLDWLYRSAKNLYKLGKYQESILASKDVLSIAQSKKTTKYDDIYFTLFNSMIQINSDEAVKIYGELDKKFHEDKRMLEVYFALLNQKPQVDSAKIIYAKNLYRLQNHLNIKDYTPFVDFILIDALKQNNAMQEAYEIATKLTLENIKETQKQKALYIKADLEIKQNNKQQAKETLQQCTQLAIESSWKTLCEQSKDLLKE